MIETHKNRAIITLSGPERKKLLQGIITANIDQLKNGHGLYGALLSPQGKFLHDFFLYENDETIYLDCERDRLADLFRRLLMYRLRSNVEIIDQSENYSVVTSSEKIDDHDLSFSDPRHPEMGYRAIVKNHTSTNDEKTYHARRIALGIPEGSNDFIVDKSTVLEGHFEQINGVDFEKGCYVGQEVTARMKYRGKIKKLMFPVTLSDTAPAFGSDIIDEKGNKIGDLRSHCDKYAIALFRIDKMKFGHDYDCCGIKVTPFKTDFYEENANA
tara:strand:- start:118575 stop:119387 length:813 start_codon:yes stop_codon:yes gene_type:complete